MPLTNTVFLITFSVMMLLASSNGMTVSTDVTGSGCHFRQNLAIYLQVRKKTTKNILVSTFSVQSKIRNGHLTNESRHVNRHNTRIPLIKCGYIYSSAINVCPTNESRSSIQSSIFEHRVCCAGTRDVTTCHLPCRQCQWI